MGKNEQQNKLEKLEKELAELKERLEKTLAKSNEIFWAGGDGWHDNPAYDLMNADVDKIGALMDEVRDEIQAVRNVAKNYGKVKKNEGLFLKIRKTAAKIPKGKVATYGQIALMVGIPDARQVGWALHGNQDPKVPCHRVLFADGSLAKNYSLGGCKEQRARLLEDGLKFDEETRVNLAKYQWRPNSPGTLRTKGRI